MIELIISNSITFVVSLILGAKIYKNRERLEEWSRHHLKILGVPLD